MHHVMFDVDGTLVNSYEFDEECFIASVKEITGQDIISDWSTYPHVTDLGILQTFIERQAQRYSVDELQLLVKKSFIAKIKKHLVREPAKEVAGAKKFFDHVIKSKQYTVSIATGGWRETAKLKLKSAGFDLNGVFVASANDHFSRTEIMKISRSNAASNIESPVTYFGDAAWDLNACKHLDINLVIVGSRVNHTQVIPDYSDLQHVLNYVQMSNAFE